MTNNYLTKTEYEIMQYFWTINKELTARNIRDYFSNKGKNWSKQSVSTFLKNLVELGFLKVNKISATKYYYSVAISRDEYDLLPAKKIINDVFNGSYSDFVCTLVSSYKNLSKDDLIKLENILNELQENNNNNSY